MLGDGRFASGPYVRSRYCSLRVDRGEGKFMSWNCYGELSLRQSEYKQQHQLGIEKLKDPNFPTLSKHQHFDLSQLFPMLHVVARGGRALLLAQLVVHPPVA